MSDKRDEVIEAARKFAQHEDGQMCDCGNYEDSSELMADFALSREVELRRQIADDLQKLYGDWDAESPESESVRGYIEKLRGNK